MGSYSKLNISNSLTERSELLMNFVEIMEENIMSALLFWLVFLISILLAYLYQKSRVNITKKGKTEIHKMSIPIKSFWFVLIIIGPTLIFGLRDYNVGADTANNVNGFLEIGLANSFNETFDSIIGSGLIFVILRYVSFIVSDGNATFFLLILSFLTLLILIYALDKWIHKISLPMALFVYYAFFAMQLLNQSRQMLALSVLVLALNYLLKRSNIKYFFTIIIASLIHFTALVGLLFPLFNFRYSYITPIKNWGYYIIILLSPLLVNPVLNLMSKVIPNSYNEYLQEIGFDGLGLGLVLITAPIILPIIIFHCYLRSENSSFLVKLGLLTFPFRLSGYFSYFIMRMYHYSAIAIIFIIPIIIRKINNKNIKAIAVIGFITLYLAYYFVKFVYLDEANMFPYRSIIMN